MDYLRGALGLTVLVSIAILFSSSRKSIDWRLVITGLILQIVFGILVTKVDFVIQGFYFVSKAFVRFLDFALVGSEFVFGGLARNSFNYPNAGHNLGFIFAFQVLPTIIFFSAVSSGLYYLGILQKIVYGIAWIMAKTMRLSGPESLSAAGNIFLGQTEAPLLVRPFVPKMTRSELLCLMTGGMATLAGGVLAAYVSFLGGDDPAQRAMFAAHLLTASIMNAPAGILISKILLPQLDSDKVDTQLEISKETMGSNVIDAMATGAAEGLKLALNVGGMLLAFVAVIAFLNYLLGKVGGMIGLNDWIIATTSGTFKSFSLEYLLGQIFRVLAFLMGVEWKDSLIVGSLLGQKTAINEFVAYVNLAEMKNAGLLNMKSIVISTYALCGFSNFSSIAIQIGGIGSMAPNQQANLSQLGMKALLGATLACMMSATIAGALY